MVAAEMWAWLNRNSCLVRSTVMLFFLSLSHLLFSSDLSSSHYSVVHHPKVCSHFVFNPQRMCFCSLQSFLLLSFLVMSESWRLVKLPCMLKHPALQNIFWLCSKQNSSALDLPLETLYFFLCVACREEVWSNYCYPITTACRIAIYKDSCPQVLLVFFN